MGNVLISGGQKGETEDLLLRTFMMPAFCVAMDVKSGPSTLTCSSAVAIGGK